MPKCLWARPVRAAVMVFALVGSHASGAESVAIEQSDIATLRPNMPHRFFAGGLGDAFGIFDADSGRMEGSIPAGYQPLLALTPDNKQFLVSETYWAHGARGKRDDLVTVYDATTLKVVKEINLPTRALAVGVLQFFQVSADGSKAYVYALSPASSVIWVDLKRQAVGGTVELPGCSLIFPFGNSGFSSLCADGSLATINLSGSSSGKITHTKPFFDAGNDPIYDNSLVDLTAGKALLLSYTGLVYSVKLGSEPVIDKPWSIQQAAGFAPAGTGEQELAWRPGGYQPAAYHRASGHLFVLMHMGAYWTHKQGGTEVWVLDTNNKKLLKRIALQPIPTSGLGGERVPYYANIAVSQDADKPLVYLAREGSDNVVMDANTGEIVRKIESEGNGFVLVSN